MAGPTPKRISPLAPTKDQVRKLLEATTDVRDHVKGAAKPVIIEFAGTPRSGKSTCISIMKHFLRRNGMAVFSPTEGASLTPEFLKTQLFEYNTWAACYALMTILEGVFIRQPQKYDFVLLDRGLFDAICWLSFVRNRRSTSDAILPISQFKRITRFLRIDRWKEHVDLVCLFTCNAREAWRREHDAMLIKKGGVATNVSFLTELLNEYRNCAKCYSSDFRNFIWLKSTTRSSSKAAAYVILQRLFEIVTKQRE